MYEPKVQFGKNRGEGMCGSVQFCHETVSRGHYFKSFCRQITQFSGLRSLIQTVNSSDTNKLNNYFKVSQYIDF